MWGMDDEAQKNVDLISAGLNECIGVVKGLKFTTYKGTIWPTANKLISVCYRKMLEHIGSTLNIHLWVEIVIKFLTYDLRLLFGPQH